MQNMDTKQFNETQKNTNLRKEKNPFEISDCIENLEENTFIREVRDGSAISKSLPPSISSAMKALQNKVKALEKENESLKVVNQNLEFELKSQVITKNKKLELEILELKQKSFEQVYFPRL